MKKQFQLFVGYFSSRNEKKDLGQFIVNKCPDVAIIRLYACLQGEDQELYCCKLTFNSKASLNQSAKILRRLRIKGQSLLVRDWADRKEFNERRAINWRTVEYTNGENTRKKDRRRYRDPITLLLKK